MNEAFKVNVCQSLDRGEKEFKKKKEQKTILTTSRRKDEKLQRYTHPILKSWHVTPRVIEVSRGEKLEIV